MGKGMFRAWIRARVWARVRNWVRAWARARLGLGLGWSGDNLRDGREGQTCVRVGRERGANLRDGRGGNCVRGERERCNNLRKARVTNLCQGGEAERGKFARGGRATNKYRQTNQINKKTKEHANK